MSGILDSFSRTALVRAIEANQIEFWATIGRLPQVELYYDAEMMWIATGIPHPAFNVVFGTRFERVDVDARIKATLQRFESQGLPMMWRVGPSTRPVGLGRDLVARGLEHAEDEAGMAADLSTLRADAPEASAVTIQLVSNAEMLEGWIEVLSIVFGIPESARRGLFDIEASLGFGADVPRRLYVGLYQGVPVATSLLFLGAGVAGISAVGTLPGARRQGIGTLMTLAPLRDARAMGYRIGTLHASEMGLGMYRRLGFCEYCKLASYVWTGERK